jgi:hypothetical protein
MVNSLSSQGDAVWGLTKNKPAMPPTGTQREMALGSFTAGSPHSSAMAETIPIAEKVYAAGRMPMKKEKPPHPDRVLS